MTLIHEAFDGKYKLEVETTGYGGLLLIFRAAAVKDGQEVLETHQFELKHEEARIFCNLLDNHLSMYE
ncbi:MAG TPA: hypothetical protein VM681_09315 [Candidatus Thermoplasmatota archaeon]|nr:hypothetical protein [Candidatus Thermoplasmatota archaeon]